MRSETRPTGLEGDFNPYAAPTSRADQEPSPVEAVGSVSWPIFLGMGIVAGTFFWLFWSVSMSVLMWHDLARVLAGPGAACGLFFGAFFGGLMAIVMRPAATTFPVADRDDFLSRLDGEMARLRYRPLTRSEGSQPRTYAARTLFHPHAFNITVRVGPGEVTLVGPKANIQALRKQFES